MFNVCPACGLVSEEKQVRPPHGVQAELVCQYCGHTHPFLRLPLFAVSGASGTGKSTLALALAQRDRGCLHLESDILWRAEFDRPDQNYRDYRSLWLRLCANIGQGGRPVVLYGSVTPDQFDQCPERAFLGPIHTLALVCAPEVLAERLRSRPAWRAAGSADFIEKMLRFNAWFLEHAERSQPAMTLFDTTHASLEDTCTALLAWIQARFDPERLETK
jgi:predicted kinase